MRPVGILALAVLILGATFLLAVVGHPAAALSAISRAERPSTNAVPMVSGAGPIPASAVRPDAFPTPPVGPSGIVATIAVGSAPGAIAYDSGKHELFVANGNSNNVSVIAQATGTVVATIPVGTFPFGVAYDSGKNEVYVTNIASNNVSVISDATNAVVASIQLGVGDWPTGIVYDSGKNALFVANIQGNSIVEISDSTNAVINTISAGMATSPLELAYDSGLGQIFVSLHSTGQVLVIDDTTLATTTINVGQTPAGIAYDSAKSEIFVANNGSNSVSVIADMNESIVATVTVSTNPWGLAYGPGTGQVAVTYIENLGGTDFGFLGLIGDGNNTLFASVGLFGGGAAQAVVYDSGNSGWYVADTSANFVVVVVVGSLGYDVTITETGLATGTAWEFWFNGTGPWGKTNSLYSSSAATAHLTAGNGAYTFTIVAKTGFRISPATGSITVAGAAVTQSIVFTFLYSVTFTETGLPAGTAWTVTYSGVVLSSSATTVAFSEGNGTHAFTVNPVSGYDASPSSGNVSVSGASATQAITFTASSTGTPPPSTAPGLFGLPGDTGLIIVVVIVLAAIGGVVAFLRMRGRKAPPSSGTPPTEPGAPPPTG